VRKTFAEAADYWERERSPSKRSFKDDISMLKQLRQHFGTLQLNDAEAWVAAIDRYKTSKAGLSPKTVANHLTLLGSILRVAEEMRWLERLPKIRKPRIKAAGTDFSYLRTEDEIRRFLQAARHEGEQVFVLFATAIFTGLRAGELAGLRWVDVDLEQRLIMVRRSFEGPTKSDEPRPVPLVDALLPTLRAWRLQHPGNLVFTNRDGRMLQPSSRLFQEVLHRVLDRAGFPKVERGGKLRRYVHFHSLRHTFASHWAMRGGDLFKLQKVLGHANVTMTNRYAHLQPAAFAEDYGRFGSGALGRDFSVDGSVAQVRSISR
jgi:integrase